MKNRERETDRKKGNPCLFFPQTQTLAHNTHTHTPTRLNKRHTQEKRRNTKRTKKEETKTFSRRTRTNWTQSDPLLFFFILFFFTFICSCSSTIVFTPLLQLVPLPTGWTFKCISLDSPIPYDFTDSEELRLDQQNL